MTIISNCTAEVLRDAARALREGSLVVFPTETVYGLGADASNEKAVRRIYEVKGRPLDHPVIVHVGELSKIEYWISEIPDYAVRLAREFWPGPMTLVLPRSKRAADFITGGQESVGLRVPDHPVALQLLKEFHSLGGEGIAAPSANRFGKVSPTSSQDTVKEIGNYLHTRDVILEGNQSRIGIESTIISCLDSHPQVLRPGAVTIELIESVLGQKFTKTQTHVRVSGNLQSHYAPKARVLLDSNLEPGMGLIALGHVPTPPDVVRLASPASIEEFAYSLYSALHKADSLGLKAVVIITPKSDGLGVAIRDRLVRASSTGYREE